MPATTFHRNAACAALAALLVGAPAHAFTLHVLHINDLHSRIEPINAYDSTCSAEDEEAGECFGGVARLATAINARRAELEDAGENVILLDAGDQFQGSLFFNTYEGQAAVEFMNRMGFDAMAFGNHEFNLGPEPLAAFVAAAEFPVGYGNVDAADDTGLGPLDKDPVVLEVGGKRIGIATATTPDTAEISSPGPTISFGDPVEHLREAVAAFEADGVDHVIALTHLGVIDDIRVASEVAGLDLIVGGHSHTLFSNSLEDALHPYPLMVEGPDGVETPIVQAGAYSKYLGHIVLEFDDEGRASVADGDTMLINASVEPDPDIAARVSELAAPLEEVKSRLVAEIPADIDGSREICRSVECEMGNLVADAMLDRVQAQGVTIALQNGGGLRASIEKGEVTKGDVLAVLPFQNTLATFNLDGASLLGALENGVSEVEEGAGRFPQVAGLRFTWDPAAAAGQGRIQTVEVREGEDWVPLDPAKIYSVVSNNFLRNGGDGYDTLRDGATNAYDFGPNLEDVVSDYLAARPNYIPYVDGRISTVE